MPQLNKSQPVNITLWHYYKGSQMKTLQKLIAEFNAGVGKEQGIIINAVSMRSSAEIYDQLLLSANGEPGAPKLPELATVYPDTAYTLYNMDLLSPFNQYLNEEELNSYIDSFLNEGKIIDNQDIYVFPTSKSSEVLMINNTVYQRFLNEYNRENPNNQLNENMLSTFEGVLETAKAYYEWTDAKTPTIDYDGKALFGLDSPSNFSIVGYHQLGEDFFSENEEGIKTINFKSDTFKKVWDYYYAPMVKGYFAAYSFYRAEDTQTGDILMYIGSTGGASFFPTTVTYSDNTKIDIQLKVLPFPVFENGQKSAVLQGAGITMTKSTPQKEYASTVFLKWFTSPKRNTEFVLNTGYLPVTKKAFKDILPDKLSVTNDDPQLINISKVISLANQMYNDYDFYTYKPFKNSEDIRFYYEDMILEKSKETRESFFSYIKSGNSYDDAVNKYLSEAAMDNFIKEAQDEIVKWKN